MKGTFAFCENDQHDNLYISFILQLVLLLLISFSSVQFHAIFFRLSGEGISWLAR